MRLILRTSIASRGKVHSSWALALSRNIAERSMMGNTSMDELAAWESGNWVEVEYWLRRGKKVLRRITIHRSSR